MNKISLPAQKLAEKYRISTETKENSQTIHVDEVASRVAAFYEKIRGIIDWKEEHLLKRRAIERILKRRIFSKMALTEEGISGNCNFAEPFVMELIRGGHFPNDKIEESKIKEVQDAINKYIFIIRVCQKKEEKSKIELYSWLTEIAACEIEEILSPSIRERALMDYMTEAMKERIKISDNILEQTKITEEEKKEQTYIAAQRALFKLDPSVITYHILKRTYSDWKNMSREKLSDIAENIYEIKENMDKVLEHPISDKFYQIAEKYDTPFLLLGDALSASEDLFSSPENLEKEISRAYKKRVSTLKKRLGRAALYSTLSIFLTNIVSLFIIEIPFNKWITGYYFNMSAMLIDIFVPTFLMFFLVATVRPPSKENLPRVIMEVMKIVYEKELNTYEIKSFGKKKNIFLWGIINTIYLICSALIISLIVWGLSKVNFPPLSHIIFIIFFALIAFAGTKIRQRAKELQVIEERESFLHFFTDPFAIPIIQLGKWLTLKWKKYNIIAVFFSALIDMPFTVFVEFIEQWRYFIKEKKEKIH
ncbi:MAG: hypothetical protein A2365_03925 [Candidatus Nealsonbacteria bacterium RIFOXYB1_FULL_40_15]|uniref:Uncharacterized protein n=2 Tax=Candidatus Nealsoniibacteriota TaxID=1817911 RepID=A0A1G2ET15_9BACT|nr:MAG: hypothetical protein A2365_03925 [Candidatus Nealsonbacteria bacterium RIFOXYB1_FULL_40_15]OGZ28602.1 MAG: hypothetical protein A2562_03625 [Candidatus Nealsonbacteria bacterium RIFOXYD1_FULL_39_11]OGZ28893.1 MAG: hypothetical protein A2427_01990 [Candidatus Nealsonbacteria bacterium RIFOXYC1_FULL_40_7]